MSLVLKETKVTEYFIKSVSLFQSMGDAQAKDLSPYVEVLHLETDRLMDLEERRERRGV